jgi:hypothetical protein
MNNVVFWDVAPCGSCYNRRFRGTSRFHVQSTKNYRAINNLLVTDNVFYSLLIQFILKMEAKRYSETRYSQDAHDNTCKKTACIIVTAVKTSILHSINWLGSVVET